MVKDYALVPVCDEAREDYALVPVTAFLWCNCGSNDTTYSGIMKESLTKVTVTIYAFVKCAFLSIVAKKWQQQGVLYEKYNQNYF
jgi:hypothetical protein